MAERHITPDSVMSPGLTRHCERLELHVTRPRRVWTDFTVYGSDRKADSLSAFRNRVTRLWRTVLIHRGQKHHLTWVWMRKLADRWIPAPRVLHPYPRVRFDAIHPR